MVNSNAGKSRDGQEQGTDAGGVRTRKVRRYRKRNLIGAKRNTSNAVYLLTPRGVFQAEALGGPIYRQLTDGRRGRKPFALKF